MATKSISLLDFAKMTLCLTTFEHLLVISGHHRRKITYLKLTQMNLSCNFLSIDGSEVHFFYKTPSLTTHDHLLVMSGHHRRNITYFKVTQMNLSRNFLSIDGSEVHFSIKHYF